MKNDLFVGESHSFTSGWALGGRPKAFACYKCLRRGLARIYSKRRSMTLKEFFELLKSAAFNWSEHNAPRLGAALAYYTLLSLAPLPIIVVGICGLAFSEAAVKQQVLLQVRDL